MDGRGSIPGRGNDRIFLFATASKLTLEPTQPPVQLATGSFFPGAKAAGARSWPRTST